MDDLMPPPPGLSPVGGKLVVARFDGGCLSSDAGVLVLREIEQRMGVAERIIARVEAGEEGTDARFIVTNLAGGKPKTLYEDIYCRRGCAKITSNPGRPISHNIAITTRLVDTTERRKLFLLLS